MPIYEFICRSCTKEFEELVFSRTEAVACPDCGSTEVERALSVFSSSSSGRYRSSAGSSCDSCSKSSCAHCSGH